MGSRGCSCDRTFGRITSHQSKNSTGFEVARLTHWESAFIQMCRHERAIGRLFRLKNGVQSRTWVLEKARYFCPLPSADYEQLRILGETTTGTDVYSVMESSGPMHRVDMVAEVTHTHSELADFIPTFDGLLQVRGDRIDCLLPWGDGDFI
ncbi:hypothetical protein NG799_28540 [Laspinema sp. D1]|uniref:Uncharacterized protein n=1 Tax=Laspinema palackyanum D2a TaxID=2953684 RepID=A0ABT2MZV2_9CYAN|nr:hypothetical protein [Laspinema sp. D2a]